MSYTDLSEVLSKEYDEQGVFNPQELQWELYASKGQKLQVEKAFSPITSCTNGPKAFVSEKSGDYAKAQEPSFGSADRNAQWISTDSVAMVGA